MIRITKPSQAPAVLTSKGTLRREEHCQDYESHRADYDAGRREFAFDKKIYGHRTVKQALMRAQHDKCCYCERKVDRYDDVEHFRPKACYQQTAGGALQTPGYYALAYDWENLLVSCAICNRSHKRNLFPLADPSRRAVLPADAIADETPLLLNPALLDPEQYITFDLEAPVAINNNPYGRATIEATGLDRDELNNARRELLLEIFVKRDILLYLETLPPSAERDKHIRTQETFLRRVVSDANEYAGMARAAAKNDFLRPLV